MHSRKMIIFVVVVFQLAVRCMDQEEISQLYIAQAEQLEAQGRFKEAEKLVNVLSLFFKCLMIEYTYSYIRALLCRSM